MRRHVSTEALALYREGAVSARRAAGIASHLSSCSRCGGVIADLANVSALLTAAPLPPMPDALVVRIQSAIASESVLRATTNPVTSPVVNCQSASSNGSERSARNNLATRSQ